jgi:DNA helicase HerA-like ATPase
MNKNDGSNESSKLSNTPPATTAIRDMPAEFVANLEEEISAAGGEWQEDQEFEGSVGRTMFDTPSSQDNTVTVLMASDKIAKLPSQSLVRIKSRAKEKGGDGREYLGAVTEGPFAEPDGLRADAPVVIIPTIRGAAFMPKFHGRVQIEILGEEVEGDLVPPRFRPLPNSPVFPISDQETSEILGLAGKIDLGYAVGFENMPVRIPADRKTVLPRHLAVLGTTGGGKSTTVSGLIHQFSNANMATVVLDIEGEYTEIGEATQDKNMLRPLERIGRKAEGVPNVHVYHLVGTASTAAAATPKTAFKVDFSSLSPYAAAEILDLSDAQLDRFFKAYDTTKLVLRDLKIFPKKGVAAEERAAIELNEFETGYPRMTLSHLIDIGTFFLNKLAGTESEPFNTEFKSTPAQAQIKQRVGSVSTNNEISWKTLLGKLYRLNRLRIFDNPTAKAIPFDQLVQPGRTSLIDLNDTAESPYIRNLVIADILRGLQIQQEEAYVKAEKEGKAPTPLMVIIEESHEFLSRDRIAKMHNLFEQVARIARRGRKRWMGLMFVTQLPQHLPDELFSLVNNYILHKIGDSNVIARLRKSVGGIDDSMWKRLPNLAPGQAIVSAMSMTRPLLTTINPTPCKLRMID